jgi:5-formyltetrahydrofolate cyclo-ligase
MRRRDEMSAEEREAASMKICRALMDNDLFLDARGVHVYLPIKTEVDIRPLIKMAWAMGKSVGMMHVNEDGGSQQLAIGSGTEFRPSGSLGILQPIDAEPFDMNECDVVIVPVVAVDLEGNRIGYGKGYYDQFLSFFPRPTIGVAFEVQIFDHLPHDEGDITLDYIYTEERVLPDTGEEFDEFDLDGDDEDEE